jgi:hypothetical protein
LAGHKSGALPHLIAGSGPVYGNIGGKSGHELGSVQAPKGVYFDRSELPKRFQRQPWSQDEIDAIDSGGASLW